ncbi:MAG: hypothetical protein J5528_03845, partial [Firmicutes bacterium]|nr:hypothetical protein [Bacillota bacterium]
SDGEDLTSRVEVEEKALIGESTTLNWNYEGSEVSEELKGEYTIHPATRSHLAWAGITFERGDNKTYKESGLYWCDRELMVGVDNEGIPSTYPYPSGGGINSMYYLQDMNDPEVFEENYVNGSIPGGVETSAGYITSIVSGAYVKYNNEVGYHNEEFEHFEIASNYASSSSMVIEHAGLLFKDFHFAFKIENYGKKGTSSYYYPLIWFEYNDKYFDSRSDQNSGLEDGVKLNVRSDTDHCVGWLIQFDAKEGEYDGITWCLGSDQQSSQFHYEGAWGEPDGFMGSGTNLYTSSSGKLSRLRFGDDPFYFGVDFKNIAQYDQNYRALDKPEVADSQTIVEVVNFNFGRRAFTYKNGTFDQYETEQEDPMVMPVVIYTSNDDNEVQNGWSAIDVGSKEGIDLYNRLAPEISIAQKRGGVTLSGSLYVGSTLIVDCSKASGYSVADKGVYLTRSDGKVVAIGEATDKENVWELTFLWPDMTEEDLSDTYQINVIYERRQTLKLDIGPSVPRLEDGINVNPAAVPASWNDFFGYDEKTGECSKKITIEYGSVDPQPASNIALSDNIIGYMDEENSQPIYQKYGDYTNFQSAQITLDINDFNEGNGNGVFDTIDKLKNVQAICFGQDEEDTILFNKHSYKGNEFIPLSVNDVNSENLTFFFYDSEYSDAMSTMVAYFDHAELYCDRDGGGISGEYSGGIFVPSGEDEYVGIIKGEHFEQEFAPYIDEDGVLHQYYIKAFYSMRPRALKKPSGSIGNQKAQVFPVFLSAVTDPDEEEDLTKEQKAYRYVDGENVDGHDMYGKEATALSYIDIPLGGDTSKVKRYSVTTGIYDTSGEKLIDSENTTEYIWEPAYAGALKVQFESPEPIFNDDNITQKTIPYAGESPERDEETGKYLYTNEGLDKINAYLGAFAGRSIFGVCVQVQQKEYNDIKSLSEIAPESIEFGNVSSVPNAASVLNFESGENKDETQGQTPDGTGFNEFGGDIGIDLPSLEFGIGDYATLVMDGNQIGISIGLPLFKAESTSYSADNTTTNADGSKVETYKEDGADVKKTTRSDGSVETEKVSTTTNAEDHTKTVTKRIETVDKDGNKTYHNETTTYKTENGKPDKPLTTVTDTNAPNTPTENKSNGFAEANGQMVTLGQFISSVAKRAGGQQGSVKDFMKGAFEDDTFKQAKNGKSTSRKLSFSLSVQIALTFEYNPIYNRHVFKEGALSASASFEFTLQYRFTPVPLVYVYVKTGIGVEIGIGMGMIYSLEEDGEINTFEKGNFDSLKSKNGQLIFKLDEDYSGFHATYNGKMYMEVFDHMPQAGDKALTSGVISSSGSMKEILLTQYDSDLYISLTSIGDKVTMMSIKPITKASKAYFNGAFITPSISIEAGVGVGIELLKFELYVKTNLAITATFGQYIPEEDAYEPAYMSNFDWSISVGFNIVLLFINYSMDLVAFSVNGEQDGTGGYYTWVITASAANGMKELWTETRYTDAHGNPISGPRSGMRAVTSEGEKKISPAANGNGLIKISSPTDITATQKINAVKTSAEELQKLMRGEIEDMRSFPATGTKDFELSGYGVSGDARVLATGLTTGYSYKLFQAEDENYIIYPRMIDDVAQLVMSKVIMAGDLSIGTGLQNPVSATAEVPFIVLDGDGLADYDYSVDVDGSTITAVWTTDGEKGIVTKTAALDLNGNTGFSEAKVLTADDGAYRYLPDQTGNISVFAESSGSAGERNAAKLAYRAYLIAKNPELVGEDYDLLEDGDTNNPILVSAVFSY